MTTLEIFSANWAINGGKDSFVKFGDVNVNLQRGYNLFGILDGYMHTLSFFDGFEHDVSETMQNYIYGIYNEKKYEYLIMVTHDDVTNKTTPRIVNNYLVFLGCDILKDLQFRGSYMMIYDLRKMMMVKEVCDNKFPVHEWLIVDDGKIESLGLPVYIIVYNLLHFTKRTVEQLMRYTKNIHIIDNRSVYPELLEYYEKEYKFYIHKMGINYGHTVWEKQLLWQMPRYFAITDPDLEFNDGLPLNFLEQLCRLTDKYKKGKCGFALDLSDAHLFYQDNNYFARYSIENWEKQFWHKKIINSDGYELYDAQIDTTFCVVNRAYLNGLDAMRVGGVFVCKHIPWYVDWHNKLSGEEWEFYRHNNISSSTLKLLLNKESGMNDKNVILMRDIDDVLIRMGKLKNGIESDIIREYMENCIDMLTNHKVIINNNIFKGFNQ